MLRHRRMAHDDAEDVVKLVWLFCFDGECELTVYSSHCFDRASVLFYCSSFDEVDERSVQVSSHCVLSSR